MNPHHIRLLYTFEKWFVRAFLGITALFTLLGGTVFFTTPALRDSVFYIFNDGSKQSAPAGTGKER